MRETRETHLVSYHQVTFEDTLIYRLCHPEFVRCGASIKSPRLETKKKVHTLGSSDGPREILQPLGADNAEDITTICLRQIDTLREGAVAEYPYT